MSRTRSRIVGSLFAAAIGSSLMIGVVSLVAQPESRRCAMGTCTTQAECQANCDAIYGRGNSIGDCARTGCCLCESGAPGWP